MPSVQVRDQLSSGGTRDLQLLLVFGEHVAQIDGLLLQMSDASFQAASS
jgi:hypothetical protein